MASALGLNVPGLDRKDGPQMADGTSILPCGQANPRRTETIEYFDIRQVAYVLQKDGRTRPTRVVFSYGDLGTEWRLGTRHVLRHDQTWQGLGEYRVVGIIDYALDLSIGDVPDRSLAYAVFK